MSNFTLYRQSQDDYNDRREAEHKRQEAQEAQERKLEGKTSLRPDGIMYHPDDNDENQN